MLEKVRKSIQKAFLFTPGMRIVVAVSGGADSVCLLHLLTALRAEYDLELIAVHLNHGFRGTESDEDARYVEALAESLDVESIIHFVDVPAMRTRRHLSAQEAARDARHMLLRSVYEEKNADRIALGHTRDDRVETVLGNILRGTGLDGLAAMPPKDLPLIRPLYEITRAETHAYCVEHNLNPRHDSSNANLHYRRNRLRNELLPQLRAQYNVQIDSAILRLSELAVADSLYLEQMAQQSFEECLLTESDEQITLDSAKLVALPLAMQRRVVRQAIEQIRGSVENISFEAVEQALVSLRENSVYSRVLPAQNGISVRLLQIPQQQLWIIKVRAETSAIAWEMALAIPGKTEVPQAQMSIETEILPFGERKNPMSGLRFPLSEIELPLVVRSRHSGDQITWGSPRGTSKIQDILTDYKIPKEQRNDIPIIVDNAGKVLCVGSIKHHKSALNSHSLLPPDEQILEIRFHRFTETVISEKIQGTFTAP